jgi:hypothetical protein
MLRTLLRRLERLEVRAGPATEPLSFLIHFVHPEKGVTHTLRLGPGREQVWADLQPDPGEWPPSTSINKDHL